MNTTPADILKQLQNAWTVAAIPPPTEPAQPEKTSTNKPKQFAGVLLTGKTEPCRGHPQPLETIDEPDEGRPDWIRSHCRHCQRFLGYRRDE